MRIALAVLLLALVDLVTPAPAPCSSGSCLLPGQICVTGCPSGCVCLRDDVSKGYGHCVGLGR